MDTLNNIRRFIQLTKMARRTLDSDASDSTKDGVILVHIVQEMLDLGMEWAIPRDLGRDDLEAYVEAFERKAEEFSIILEAWRDK